MENEKNILSDWRRRKRPSIPNGFFDQFVDDLMQRIEDESSVLGQLRKSEKPEVPENFFESILSSLDVDNDEFSIETLKKNKKPALPINYFSDSENQILEIIKGKKQDSNKRGRIIPLRLIATIGSIAAAIAIIFTIINFSEDTNSDIAVVEVESSEDTYDAYLAYLDEDEIVDFIIENDIEIEDSTNTVQYEDYSDFSEEDIEDFYLDIELL